VFALGALLDREVRADQVVVIVDSSASMKSNDPDQVAVLATLMLAELLDVRQDDLVVFPLDSTARSATHLTSQQGLRWSDYADTLAFRDGLQAHLSFDGQSTWFSPTLVGALESFLDRSDRKLLILLTDGISSNWRADEARLRADFLAEARRLGVEAWLVGLGPVPDTRPESRLFQLERIGGYVGVPYARELPQAFAKVLAAALGRTVDPLRLSPGQRSVIDIHASDSRMDILALGPGALDARNLTLSPPPAVNWAPGPGEDVTGLVKSSRRTHQYRRLRVPSPTPGAWSVFARRSMGVLVIRRHRFELDLTSRSGGLQVPAGHQLCFDAQVRSRSGAGSPPVGVTDPALLSSLQVRISETEQSAPGVLHMDPQPMRDDGALVEDSHAGDGIFGWCHEAMDDEVSKTLVAVAQLSARDSPYSVSAPVSFAVLPRLEIVPTPSQLIFGGVAPLTTEAAPECLEFTVAPPMSALSTAGIPVLIKIQHGPAGTPSVGIPDTGPLRNSTVTLDGEPLLRVGAAPLRATWTPGEHEVCVQAGHRSIGGTDQISLVISTADKAYTSFVDPTTVTLEVTTESPGVLEVWGTAIGSLAGAGVIGAMFLAARPRRQIPTSLHICSWQGSPERPSGEWTSLGGTRSAKALGGALTVRAEHSNRIVFSASPPPERRDPGTGEWRPVQVDEEGNVELQVGTTFRILDSYFCLAHRLIGREE